MTIETCLSRFIHNILYTQCLLIYLVDTFQSVCVCVPPVSFDDALGDGVSYLVKNMSVVCTADKELILEEPEITNSQ